MAGAQPTTATPIDFNPYSHEVHDDPFPFYERLREEAPVYENHQLGFYALSRYDDVLAALHDHETFCNRHGITLEPKSPLPMMLTMDPPEHTAMRRLVSRVFTPRRVADLEPSIRALSTRYLDPIAGEGHCDLITDYSARLPMDVISTMLGVPPTDQDLLRGWTDDMIHREEGQPDVTELGVEAATNLYGYLCEMVTAKRARPGDDLTSALLEASLDGRKLTDRDVVGFLLLLVIAGNETTTKLIGNAVYWLWRNPDERRKLLDDPSRIPDAVEETLRYEGSTQLTARTLTRDLELHGVTMCEGRKVLLLLGSANRDPRVWDRPDVFDIDREGLNRHLAFGHGIHVCLGAALARLETRIALEHIHQRLLDYEVDEDGIERVHSGNVRGYARLPLSFRPA
ncbi:MAG: cytochrome P450 [Acidimicrobiales bacterium]|jgi:hypothetical protein